MLFKVLRIFSTILLLLPYVFLVAGALGYSYTGLFFGTLIPCSALVLLIQLIIWIFNRRTSLVTRPSDKLKVIFACLNIILGMVLAGLVLVLFNH